MMKKSLIGLLIAEILLRSRLNHTRSSCPIDNFREPNGKINITEYHDVTIEHNPVQSKPARTNE
jgi:hypothetical protein